MPNYLYNGIELPALPEWDKETYPYALIYHAGMGYYHLVFTQSPWHGTGEPFVTPVWGGDDMEDVVFGETIRHDSTGYGYFDSAAPYSLGWELLVSFADKLGQMQDRDGDGVPDWGGDCAMWANHDVIGADGTVLIPATAPVPVGGEPDPDEPETVLAWQKHDAYKPNSKWDGNTFYRVMGGKWVKQDEVSPSLIEVEPDVPEPDVPEPDEPTGDPIAYLYNGVQLPDINTVWTDKKTYPYAMIKRAKSGGECTLFVYGDDPYYTEQAQGVEGGAVITPAPIQTFDTGNDGWVLRSEDANMGVAHRVEVFEFIWANVDIKNKDNNSVYFPESEPPVPVYA